MSVDLTEQLVERASARVTGPAAVLDLQPDDDGRATIVATGRQGSGVIWVVVGRLMGIAATIVMNIILARSLAPAEFGNFVLISSVLSLASCMALFGLNMAVVRFVPESLGKADFARARQALRVIFRVAVGTTAVVALVSIPALELGGLEVLGLPSQTWLVAMIVLGIVLLTPLQLSAEALRGLQELRLATLFSGGQAGGLLSNMIFLGLLCGAIWLGGVNLSKALGLSLVAIAVTLPFALYGLWRSAEQRLGVAPTAAATHEPLLLGDVLRVSLPLLLIQLLVFVSSQADLWIAGIFCEHDQMALYGAARRLMLMVTMPVQIANLAVVSSIAVLYGQDRRQELQQLLRRTASLAALPSLGALLLLIAFGGPTLSLLFGPFYSHAALPLGILCVGQLFLVSAGSCGCTLEMTGNQNGSLLINLVAAVALAVFGSLAAHWFGVLGLAIASAVVVALQYTALWLTARRLVGVWTHATLKPWDTV